MALKITKCQNGHFYDSEKFTSCPFCDQNVKSDVGVTEGVTMPLEKLDPTISIQAAGNATVIEQTNSAGYTPNQKPAEDSQKTVGFFDVKPGTKAPVVGWLVCTFGKHYGEDFRLKAGNNFVGRDSSMDVVFSKDTSVSRTKHVIIAFDPKSKSTILIPGDTHELSYLNNEVLIEPKILKKFDKIQIGTSELMFVPFCGDDFTWEENK